MEDILKYQRIQGAIDSILRHGKIVTSGIERNYLVIGTESGEIHVISFTGQHIQRLKAHSQPVISLSLCYADGALTILSCSSDGKVVTSIITGKEVRETSISLNEDLSVVCIESILPTGRKDRSFLVGTSNGSLFYHRQSWFAQKIVTLFTGEGSAVSNIVWRGNLVAWSDANVVRITDISTQTAICQVPAPYGVGPEDPYPCHLYWRSENELMISWADSFKLLRVRNASEEGVSMEGNIKAAKTIIEWQADSILCGVFPLDDEHVVYIGYTPPDEQSTDIHDEYRELLEESGGRTLSPAVVAARFSHTNEPEVIMATLKTGTIISADLLPLKGVNLKGPWAYRLLSSHQCLGSSEDAGKWRLRYALDSTGQQQGQGRGGDRGNAPLIFVLSPEDLVVARVRDVNDRVRSALEQKDLKHALEIALADRNSLKVYSFSELLTLYLNHLLERGLSVSAANECARLIGFDAVLWESWIYRFVDCGHIDHLCLLIPIDKPRLRNDVYELVLDTIKGDFNPSLFLELVRKWSKVHPPCFDHNLMISKLSNPLQREQRTPFLEAQAHLYLVANSYEKALNCYLQINTNDLDNTTSSAANTSSTAASAISAGSAAGNSSSSTTREGQEYRHVFELIEKQNLFKLIEGKIINLVRLSRSLSARLLLNHLDKLPIKSIAFQLAVDRRLLHWYLHLIFTDPVAREFYASPEFDDLHKRQAELYAEFAPPFQRPFLSVNDSQTLLSSSLDSSVVDLLRVKQANAERKRLFESDFLAFIKSGLAPLDVCLAESEKRYPPLYPEIIICLSMMDKRRTALSVLLREIGDVGLAIQFIENQLDSNSLSASGGEGQLAAMKRYAIRQSSVTASSAAAALSGNGVVPPVVMSEDERAMQDALLWNDLIQHALDNPICLENLFDHLGVSKVDAKKVLSKIAPHTQIPHLKPRLLRILKELTHQRTQDQFCKEILSKDAAELLCRKNHGQRRAIKVDNGLRCSSCLRPLMMEPVLSSGSLQPLSAGSLHNLLPAAKENIQVWGYSGGNSTNTAVIFNNKLAFHKQCFDRIT